MNRSIDIVVAAMLASGASQPAVGQSKADLLWKNLETTATAAAADFDGVMAIAIRDLTDGRSIAIRGDEVMPTASMIKIAVLVELYRQNRLREMYTVDAKDLVDGSAILSRLTPGVTQLTLRDLATNMIGDSDNAATNVLIDRLGMAKINAMLDGIGLPKTRLQRKMIDLAAARAGRENVATVDETVALLAALHHGKVLGAEETADLFKVLATPKSSRLLAMLPGGARGATKTGTLDGVVTEAGILYPPKRPFAIAIMTTYVRDMAKAERVMSEIALAAWHLFDRIGGSSALGRVLPLD